MQPWRESRRWQPQDDGANLDQLAARRRQRQVENFYRLSAAAGLPVARGSA
jgi:hypothetical protein